MTTQRPVGPLHPTERQTWTNGHAPERLLTASEVAEHWCVPESWVRRETRAGRLPHFRLGHYVRYRWSEVEPWLQCRAQGPAPGVGPGGSPRG